MGIGAAEFVALAATGLVALVILRVAVKREPDPVIAKLVVLGFVAKIAGTGARYFVLSEVYERGDANRYLDRGRQIAQVIRSGTVPDQARETGTPFMDFLAGVFYAVAPPNLLLGFFAFSMLAFVGMYLFVQAFRIAFPEGDHRRYTFLVLLLPTMLFWPSSLGKESWLVFTLGISAYGAARVLRRMPWGFVLLGVGVTGVYLVRPHMGALFAVTFAGAYLLRSRDPLVEKGASAWIVGLVIVGTGALFTFNTFGDLLPRDESVDGSAVEQVFSETNRRSSVGGSEYDSRPVRSPADLGHALITVPFRPFPTEAHNLQSLFTSLEGVMLFILFLASLPRLVALRKMLFRKPYVLLASAYSLGFIIAFSNVGNFGLLTRQRAQLLPFLLVLLALPKPGVAPARRTQAQRKAPVLVPTTLEEQEAMAAAAARAVGPTFVGAERLNGHPEVGTELVIDLPKGTEPSR